MRHTEWACPICDASGHCLECASLGTREAYHAVQDLHAAAIQQPDGLAAQALEHIETYMSCDLKDRAFWVSRMIGVAMRHVRLVA